MERSVLSVVLLTMLFVGCSKDDGYNCESCISDLGAKFEICNNGDGTYTAEARDKSITVSQDQLDALELTPKLYIELDCELDMGLEF
ncbi:hypothetical protein [Flagellimonas onchidii]|uniref:hypothetical protein n=1 Tax=Flagellimonas onchidii TaxID=2562684 RepID=UPI0010A5CFE0|nr:hypothetical protein [Allomuricauda onchidii]